MILSPFTKLINNLSIITRINILIGMVGVGMVGIVLLCQFYIQQALLDHETIHVKDLVTAIHSILNDYNSQVMAGTITKEDAQNDVLKLINNIRYQKDHYFFVLNTKGTMISHPMPDIHNKFLLDTKDAYGKYFMREFIDIAVKQGEGSTIYYWPLTDSRAKMSYVMYFAPWHWVIGTGNYIEEIEQISWNLFLNIGVFASIFLIIMVAQATYMGKSISRTINQLTSILRRIAIGDLSVEVPHDKRRDEIGAMRNTIHVFLENARAVAKLEEKKC